MKLTAKSTAFWLTSLFLGLALVLSGCRANGEPNPAGGAPPAAQVEPEANGDLVKVDHPEQFALATAGRRDAGAQLKVTGAVSADVSRNMPVVSLVSGRVVEIHARLGDTVQKGQLLMRVHSAEISSAFSDYRKAVTDEALAHAQLDRALLLLEHGAVPRKDVEVAQGTEDKAKVDAETAAERLHVLGADREHPTAIADIVAPASGVIVEQNVTGTSGIKTLDNSPSLFTIADLSEVWILCDVYENDLPALHEGEYADIRLNAYPDKLLKGRVDNISPILDPTLRTAKVRLQGAEPRNDATGNVRHGHVPQPAEAGSRRGSGVGGVAFARSRLGLHAPGRRTLSADCGGGRKHVGGQLAGDRFRDRTGTAGGVERSGAAEFGGTVDFSISEILIRIPSFTGAGGL